MGIADQRALASDMGGQRQQLLLRNQHTCAKRDGLVHSLVRVHTEPVSAFCVGSSGRT